MLLSPELIRSVPLPQPDELRFDLSPIQLGLCRSPWHVTMSSMILVRCKRVPSIHKWLFEQYPTPQALSVANECDLQSLLRPLGFHRTRTRYMQRASWRWDAGGWKDLRDLPGVGNYVADAVQLFCFDCVDMDSTDQVLKDYACSLRTL